MRERVDKLNVRMYNKCMPQEGIVYMVIFQIP